MWKVSGYRSAGYLFLIMGCHRDCCGTGGVGRSRCILTKFRSVSIIGPKYLAKYITSDDMLLMYVLTIRFRLELSNFFWKGIVFPWIVSAETILFWIWPYVLWLLITVHKSADTIQGWKLFVEIWYSFMIHYCKNTL